MPIHDWTRVEACIFHDFHLSWSCAISAAFNRGGLPSGYYSLVEEHRVAFAFELPDIGRTAEGDDVRDAGPRSERREKMSWEPRPDPPGTHLVAESEWEHYHRKHKTVTIRHEDGHEVVAAVEVITPADKHSRRAVRLCVEKAAQFLERNIHLLIVDIYPPGKLDPHGLHGAIWEEITGQDYVPPPDKPLTLATYESQSAMRAFVEPVAVGDRLPEMPLFLSVGRYVKVPLETTYQFAWQSMPRVWKDVIEGQSRR
jgi:hypothetical protein